MQYSDYELGDEDRAKSSLRWMGLALFFMVLAVAGQITWLIFLVTDNENALTAFVVFVGSYIIAEYCRWCAKNSQPKSWKK